MSVTTNGKPSTTGSFQSSEQYLSMDLLRFSTAGSVDDGKSTLIGRLLYDTKSIFEDQLEAIEKASIQRGEGAVDLSLLTDGLRAEREQKITIDVAYRYFATPRRKFIIADTPGHVQYTRNMVTGASTAELAIVLVDARKGVLEQSKRHAFIASLLQIPHIVVTVNKMDLVEFSEETFEKIVDDFQEFAQKLDVDDITFIPISALLGDNIVDKSTNMPWYNGPTLLHHLEHVNVGANRNLLDFRFPVQYVIRPHQDFRGFAGRVASGTVRPGEEIMVLPSRRTSKIKEVLTFEGPQEEASAGDSVTITIEDEVDISRGDMIVRRQNVPATETSFEAFLCWMNETPLEVGKSLVLIHTTQQVQAVVDKIVYRIDVDTLHRQDASELGLNEIGRVHIHTGKPLFLDPYRINHETGSFILVDPGTNVTVGAGMVRAASTSAEEEEAARDQKVSSDVVWEPWNITREEREAQNGHKAAVLWFTGLSGAGKSTIAKAVERKLHDLKCQTMLLDGDQVRHGLCGDLGFSDKDRVENIRRVGEVSRLFFEQGAITLSTFISPFRADRSRARGLVPEGRFIEVYVNADLETCKARDPKGLYEKALAGKIPSFTGVSSPYEEPEKAEIVLDTTTLNVEQAVETVVNYLRSNGLVS